MNIRRWAINASIVLVVIFIAILSERYDFNEMAAKEVPFFKQNDFNTVNSKESWELFRKELHLSKLTTKVENFELILDKKNHVYSVQFDLVDKEKDGFVIYRYNQLKEENKVSISKSNVNKWTQYNNLVYADRFFSDLHTLNQNDFFDGKAFPYKLIISTDWHKEEELAGHCYTLLDGDIKKIDNETFKKGSSGSSLQVIGSDRPSSFSTDINTTKFVFIDYYLE